MSSYLKPNATLIRSYSRFILSPHSLFQRGIATESEYCLPMPIKVFINKHLYGNVKMIKMIRLCAIYVYIAMPIQYELRRLFHLMNIQTHQNASPKSLILGAYFNS